MQKKLKKVKHILDSTLSVELLGNHAPRDISKRNGTHILKISVYVPSTFRIALTETLLHLRQTVLKKYSYIIY